MKKRILIIDDEQDILYILKTCLQKEGFEIITAFQVGNIQALIDQHCPDLIILDYILNGINGGEICKLIKSNPKNNHLPVFLFSAYPKLIESFGTYGCDGFIPKPFDLKEIVNRLNKFLNRTKTPNFPSVFI